MPTLKELDVKLDRIRDDIYGVQGDMSEIKTCLKGILPDGTNGLVHKVASNSNRINNNSRKLWIIMGVLAASGLGVGLERLLG